MMETVAIAIICVSGLIGLVALAYTVSEVIKTVYKCQRENATSQLDNYERQVKFNAQQQKVSMGRIAEYGSSMRNPLQVRTRIVRPRADADEFSVEDDIPYIGGGNTNGEPV